MEYGFSFVRKINGFDILRNKSNGEYIAVHNDIEYGKGLTPDAAAVAAKKNVPELN